MHTDLSAHLHSDKCNELIQLLRNCHKEHAFGRFLGFCNTADTAMIKCLKEERIQRRQRNYEKSLQTKEKLRLLFEQERQQSQTSANH